MKTYIMFMAVLCLAMSVYAAETKESRYLEDLKKIFDKKAKVFQIQKKSSAFGLQKEYMSALEAAQTSAQSAGNLEQVIAVRAEITRFTEKKELTADHIVEAPASLADIQKTFKPKFENPGAAADRALLDLLAQYEGRLQKMVITYTKNNKIEAAIAAKQEIDRVKKSPEVTSAQFSLAITDVPSGPSDPVEDKGTKEVKDKTPPPPPKDVRTVAGCTIYQKKPPSDGSFFKRMSLRPTVAGRLKRGIALSAQVATEGSSSSRSSYSSYCSSYSRSRKSSSKQTGVRLMLRSISGDLESVRIVAQTFVRAKDSAKVAPQQVAKISIPLSILGKSNVYIDLPQIGSSKTSSSYSSSYYSYAGRSSISGTEFYGVAVSVFDRDGNMLCQQVSPSALEEHAIASVPSIGSIEADVAKAKDDMDSKYAAYTAARKQYSGSSSSSSVSSAYKAARTAYYSARSKHSQLVSEMAQLKGG